MTTENTDELRNRVREINNELIEMGFDEQDILKFWEECKTECHPNFVQPTIYIKNK